MKLSEPIEFTIQMQSEAGKLQGPGSFDGERLQLGEQSFRVDEILTLEIQSGGLFVTWVDKDLEPYFADVQVYGIAIEELKEMINAGQTHLQALAEKSRLIEAGQLDSYDDIACPFCKATIMLVDTQNSPQVYCEHCETLFSRDREGLDGIERHFRVCKGCGMYSRPRSFSVFYFYFLVFTYGFHHDSVIRCSACMRKAAWRMVAGNLFGLLALPFALYQLKRAYSTKSLTGAFEGLDDANALASRKKLELALDKYDQVMDRVPVNAGVKFNIARGLVLQQDYEHARQMYEMSLEDCANYWPSIMGMVECLELMGDERQLAATREFWNLGDKFDEPLGE